jgi:23S rRNA (pseudouridine1915-N3)-methyltransferase
MRVKICAVGRLRAGPERDLFEDYLTRFDRTGRSLGLGPAEITEIEDKKGGGMAAEATLLERALPSGARICALDERGQTMSSPEFARMLGDWRDQGASAAVFLIGGADGLDPALRARADKSLSLGRMVWPHMLARVMLSEQLYRAATILAGSPYHRN